MGPLLWTVLAAAGLVLTHLFAGKLRLAPEPPRSIWLSGAGGLSVAYVFVHLLPELGAHQRAFESSFSRGVWIEHHVYLVALTGLIVFYGLERLARFSRAQRRRRESDDSTSPAVFWLHIASFALYNFLIGYLLVHREERSATGLVLFFVAMALHFLVTDHGLQEHHKGRYRRRGRYLVSAGIAGGFALGLATEVHAAAIATLFAFLAGGVVLNVLKDELPEERESRFWAFAAGAAAYGAILIAL